MGIGRPDDGALIAIDVGKLLLGLTEFVGDPDFFAAGAVGDEGDPLAVGRPAGVLLAPEGFGNTLDFALVGRDGEEFAVGYDGGALVGRREVEGIGFVADSAELERFPFHPI